MSFWADFRDALKVVGAVVAIYFQQYGLAAALLSDVYGRDQRRQAAKRARQQYNDSLKDRYQMVRGATETRRVVYGRARVSGPIVYVQSTGAKKEFLHLLVALAGHECDAIETVYFNDIALPAEDGAGLIQSGEFCRIDDTTRTEQFYTGSFSVSVTPSSVQSVTRTVWSGVDDDPSSYVTSWLVEGVNYSRAGAAFTVIDGGGAGNWIDVNYTSSVIAPRVRIKKFLGSSSQAASSDLITESGGKWTSAHQLKGVCYLYARLQYDQDVFGQSGLPNVSTAVRGRKVLDTRDSVTRWTENAALCTADYLKDATYGLGAGAAQVPSAEVTTAANICDQAVLIYNTGTVSVTNASASVVGVGTSWLARVRPGMNFVGPNAVSMTVLSVQSNTQLTLTANYAGATLGGQAYAINEARYTSNGAFDSADSARNNLDKLAESMAGSVTWTQGRWLMRAGAHLSAVLTITEDMLGDKAPTISPRAPRQQLFNRVIPSYAEREKLFVEMQAPPVTNATYLADDGGLDLPVEVTYDMCTGGVRAQRLAKIHLESARQALTVVLSCNLKAYDLSPSDVVALTLTRYGWSAKLFIVVSRRLDLNMMQVELTLRETASAVWDWALGAETAIDLTPNTDLPNPFTAPAALAGLVANSSAAHLLQLGSGAATPRALLTWTQSTDVFVTQGGRIEVQFKPVGDLTWQQIEAVDGAATSAYVQPIQGSTVFLIRIRPVNSKGRKGGWTTIAHIPGTAFIPGQIGGANMLPNASFEQNISGSGTPDHWLAYSAGTVSGITRTLPGSGVTGSRAMRIDATSLGATPNTDRLGAYVGQVDVSGLAGRELAVSAWFAASAQLDMIMQAGWYTTADVLQSEDGGNLQDENGAVLLIEGATADVESVATPNTTAVDIRRATGNLTAPALAAAVDLHYYITPQSGRAASAAFVLLDNAQLEVGTVATAFAPKTEEILADAVSTQALQDQAATELVTVTAAGPIDARDADTSICTANFGPYPYDTVVECTFTGTVTYLLDPNWGSFIIWSWRAFIDVSIGTDSEKAGATYPFGGTVIENFSCSHTFVLPANTSGSAIGKVNVEAHITAPNPPDGIGDVTAAFLRATVVKR